MKMREIITIALYLLSIAFVLWIMASFVMTWIGMDGAPNLFRLLVMLKEIIG